jgi:hypothetical protein
MLLRGVETRRPMTKQGKLQRGRCYPTWRRASPRQRLLRSAHWSAVPLLCVVPVPLDVQGSFLWGVPDWALCGCVLPGLTYQCTPSTTGRRCGMTDDF